VHFQDTSAPDRVENGGTLLREGLRVTLAFPSSSELVFIEATKQAVEKGQ
jgi:hypothetical protein